MHRLNVKRPDLTPKERDNRETWLNHAMHLLRPVSEPRIIIKADGVVVFNMCPRLLLCYLASHDGHWLPAPDVRLTLAVADDAHQGQPGTAWDAGTMRDPYEHTDEGEGAR